MQTHAVCCHVKIWVPHGSVISTILEAAKNRGECPYITQYHEYIRHIAWCKTFKMSYNYFSPCPYIQIARWNSWQGRTNTNLASLPLWNIGPKINEQKIMNSFILIYSTDIHIVCIWTLYKWTLTHILSWCDVKPLFCIRHDTGTWLLDTVASRWHSKKMCKQN